jgi:HPt (histidine-containing phosphotransfer) domain-containing protein
MESMLQERCSANGNPRILVYPPDGLTHNVVAIYLENCRKGLPALKAAMARFDFDFIGVYGHRMKGCGAAYGFPFLTETGAAMEQAAHVQNRDEIRNCAAAIEAHLESVEVAEL